MLVKINKGLLMTVGQIKPWTLLSISCEFNCSIDGWDRRSAFWEWKARSELVEHIDIYSRLWLSLAGGEPDDIAWAWPDKRILNRAQHNFGSSME